MTRRNLSKKLAAVAPMRAAPPRRPAPRHALPPVTDTHCLPEHQLPEHQPLMTEEEIVDAARGISGPTRLPVGAMLDESPRALEELELIASFEDERDDRRRSRAYSARLEVAIEGALATLDE